MFFGPNLPIAASLLKHMDALFPGPLMRRHGYCKRKTPTNYHDKRIPSFTIVTAAKPTMPARAALNEKSAAGSPM